MSRTNRLASQAFAVPAVLAAAVAAVSLLAALLTHAQPSTGGASVQPLLTKPLGGIDGKEALMLSLDIPPGADSSPHRHNAHTFVYVLAACRA